MQTQGSGIKSTVHIICSVVPRVPNFRPFHSTVKHLRDIPHFRFAIDPNVKNSKFHKMFIYFLADRQNSHLYSPMTAVFIIKFGPDQMKTVGGVEY